MSTNIERVVLLVGSAKPEGTSTSQALGEYLLERLRDGGASSECFLVGHAREGQQLRSLLAAIDAADLFVLCSPVYIDSLPSLVTRAFERIAVHRRRRQSPRQARFMALLNCGFPESRHCQAALDICRIFSQSAGFAWAGGLALGGGEAIHGTPLPKVGAMGRRVRQALDATAPSLLSGSTVPESAVKSMAKPLVPTQIYTLLGNFGWRQQARKHGVGAQLAATPFDIEATLVSARKISR